MTQDVLWRPGQRVRHPSRPEWGEGEVLAADRAMHEGASCQRLRIRFDRAGVRSLLTGVVRLEAATLRDGGGGGQPRGWLEELEEQRQGNGDITQLPGDINDPLRSLEDRVRILIGLYRFHADGGSLIEWASMQTGLRDPLSEHTRPQLEQQFRVFERRRDDALREMGWQLHRERPAALAALAKQAPPRAKRVMPRVNG